MKKTALVLILLFTVALNFVACSGDTTVDILDNVPDLGASEEPSVEVSEPDPEPAEGQTAMPVVKQTFNSDQTVVTIVGTCEEGAVVSASIVGGNSATATANGTVFAIQLDVGTRLEAHIQLTATAPDKTESEPKVVVSGYHPTTDGNLVYPTVLADKLNLFFKDSLAVLGEDIIRTNTAAEEFTARINSYINSMNAIGETELIYVLMPSKASGMADALPEGTEVTDGISLYDQAAAAIEASGATLIDMKAVLNSSESEALYPLYYRTHSAWSEYGSYLTYVTLMNYIAEKYPDAAPRDMSEFDINVVENALGGDLAYHFGLDTSLVTESFVDFVPKFDLAIGDKAPKELELEQTWLINQVKQYIGDNDYRPYNEYFAGKQIYNDPDVLRVDESFGFYTDRDNLPTAFIYRDEATYGAVDMLAERFNNCLFAKSGAYNVSAGGAINYASEGKENVDYIIIMVSEDNLATLIPNNND